MAHTVKFIGIVVGLLAVCLLIGAWAGTSPATGAAVGAKVFIPLWAIGAGINMWLGVTKAG